MSDVLARFHRTLVEEIRARRPDYLGAPFTVAEIYQDLVPYGTHRDRIGVEMNGDYEDALLRLLAGEGGYLKLQSEPALEDIRAELESSNPNTGLFREYAAVDVRLNQDKVEGQEAVSVADLAPAEATGDFPSESPAAAPPAEEPAPAAAPAPDTESGAVTGLEPGGGPTAPEEPGAAGRPDACPWCRAELPSRENLNFCPFCGTDIHVVPCPGCGEELEPEWRFCISCGTEVAG